MVALLTACFFGCNACALAELHQQNRARKLCSANLKLPNKAVNDIYLEIKTVTCFKYFSFKIKIITDVSLFGSATDS